jgi:succinate dehydrogenase/fumarate reductase flavoprotein subunit
MIRKMSTGISAAADSSHCDLLIVGSGAGGFAAAVVAAAAGLDVQMIEKTESFGGTTCSSAGVIWIPGSRQARAAGITDTRDAVLAYLRAQGGNRLDLDKAEIYADSAAGTLAWFEDNSHLGYDLAPAWPDYHPTDDGGSSGGRSLGPKPFDGRRLGPAFANLRLPLKTTMILGGMMVGREDLIHFYGMTRSWKSARHVARLFARYGRDRLGHPRGTRLSNGSALIAMLALTAFEAGVRLSLNTPLIDLLVEDGRVTGARVGGADGGRDIRARAGVILATGGFPGSDALRQRYFDHVRAGRNHRSLALETNIGDGFRIAGRIGAGIVENQANPAAWTPVSLAPQPDGSTIPFPHFFDRGKAGYIAVDRHGRRFVSEATSYHDFVPAMIEACSGDAEIACHLICDARAIRRFGLGMAPPAPGRLAPHVRSGYIKCAATLADLAPQCGIDAAGLAETVARFNIGAGDGKDPEFAKGADVYERFNGGAGHPDNPCIAPLVKPPYYAIRLVPGDIGTFIGLKTDIGGRALDASGAPIEGLYVAGNDAASFMGGAYPGAGITLGPALVFGRIAAETAAASLAQGRS